MATSVSCGGLWSTCVVVSDEVARSVGVEERASALADHDGNGDCDDDDDYGYCYADDAYLMTTMIIIITVDWGVVDCPCSKHERTSGARG